jgi:hypothetical protein
MKLTTLANKNLAFGLLANLGLAALLAGSAQAAIPKRVELSELMGSKWCASRKADDRRDRLAFAKDGKFTVETFYSSGTIEKVRRGRWQASNGKLSITLDNHRNTLGYSNDQDSNLLSLSTGTKAVACD